MPRAGQRIACRHCGETKSPHGRGLCSCCYKKFSHKYPPPKRPPRINVPGRRITCVRCGKKAYPRGRGLCYACARTHRHEHETGKCPYSRRGNGLANAGSPMPASPTAAGPGTTQKLLVMAERVKRGESCFHPLDAPGMDGAKAADLLGRPPAPELILEKARDRKRRARRRAS